MTELAILVGTALAGWILLTAPVRVQFAVLAFALALVPPLARVPNGVTSQLFITRALVIAAGLGLLIRRHRYEVPGGPFRRHPVTLLLAFALLVALVNGVLLVVDADLLRPAFFRWLLYVDQALIFVVLLAALRSVDDLGWAARVVVLAFAAAALVGLFERLTGERPVAAIFGDVAPTLGRGLVERAGQPRPRGTFAFAQEFGLVLAFIAPLALATVGMVRGRLPRFLPVGLLVLVSLLTITRSAVAAMAVGAVVVLLFSGSAGARRVVVTGALVAVAAALLFPAWRQSFTGQQAQRSTQVRIDRVPLVTELAADRPFTGAGFLGVADEVPAADNQLLLTYGEQGVLGVVTWTAVWVGAAVATAWGIRGPGIGRLVAAGALGGLLGALSAAPVIDLFTLGGSRAFWILAALGAAAAEGSARLRGPARPRAVAALLGIGIAVGVSVVVAYPRTSARSFVFETWPVSAAAASGGSGFAVGEVYTNTVCRFADSFDEQRPGIGVDCREVARTSGVGRLRLTAPEDEELDQAVAELAGVGDVLTGLRLHPIGATADAIPAVATTAPVWVPALLLFLAGLRWFRPVVRLTPA